MYISIRPVIRYRIRLSRDGLLVHLDIRAMKSVWDVGEYAEEVYKRGKHLQARFKAAYPRSGVYGRIP